MNLDFLLAQSYLYGTPAVQKRFEQLNPKLKQLPTEVLLTSKDPLHRAFGLVKQRNQCNQNTKSS